MVKSSNISGILATVLFGFLAFSSTNAFNTLNPTGADLIEALRSNQGLEASSVHGPEPVLTNAQRFARHLPPAPPLSISRLRRSHRLDSSPRIQRRAGASNLPFLPIKGVIQVKLDTTGADIGYLSRVLNSFGEYGSTVTLPLDPNALIVEIPGAIFASGGAFFNLPSPNTAAGFPLVGGTQGFASSDENLESGSSNYVYFTEVNSSPAHTTGQKPGNSFNTATGLSDNSQSSIWNYDSITGSLTITWTNTNGDSVVNPQALSVDGFYIWTGDATTFSSQFGGTPVSFSFVPI